jgi:uncharacterized protein (UPF0303 family)
MLLSLTSDLAKRAVLVKPPPRHLHKPALGLYATQDIVKAPMDSKTLLAAFQSLILPGFSEEDALSLGAIIVAYGRAERLPIVIDIRTATRTLFHAGLPGSAGLNDTWARRKSNTALLFQEPSFLVGTRHREKGETLAKHGLDTADYADHGGAVPIVVAGVGMVAVCTVSGLPQADDHALVIRALRQLMAKHPKT